MKRLETPVFSALHLSYWDLHMMYDADDTQKEQLTAALKTQVVLALFARLGSVTMQLEDKLNEALKA